MIDVAHPSLEDLVDPAAAPEVLATGYESGEGPIWVDDPGGGHLLFSEVRAGVRHRWDERDGARPIARPTSKAVGMTLDLEGRLVVCEHVTSALVRMDASGTGAGREVLATHYEGRELNSPNDVVVAADGAIWFTDPLGGRGAASGLERPQDLDFQGVFRLRADGVLELVGDDFELPNGLCFSPDGSVLYVNDTPRAHIRAFDLDADGHVAGERMFAERITTGVHADGWVDGMKCDEHGNVWVTGPHGIWVLDPTGTRLGTIHTPDPALNLHWGAPDWSALYITTKTSLLRLPTRTSASREPFMR